MVIFHSYVSLPEGNQQECGILDGFIIIIENIKKIQLMVILIPLISTIDGIV